MDEFWALAERMGLRFADPSLLLRALTHRSFLNENPGLWLEDNERLEFLGDAVLDFAVGAFLYNHYPEMQEGELTMLRAALVRTKTLAQFARQLGVGRALRLGYGEAESGGRERAALLCAAFEAIVGAYFLDQGMPAVEAWLPALIGPKAEEVLLASAHRDAKSEFQIWAQAHFSLTPHYELLSAEGPDHAKTFSVAAVVNDVTWGVGQGPNKQAAAQMAAAAALERVAELDLQSAGDGPA
ncbi:MAG: ribonuclease III [Candidatus Promineifilaceae bacterium]